MQGGHRGHPPLQLVGNAARGPCAWGCWCQVSPFRLLNKSQTQAEFGLSMAVYVLLAPSGHHVCATAHKSSPAPVPSLWGSRDRRVPQSISSAGAGAAAREQPRAQGQGLIWLGEPHEPHGCGSRAGHVLSAPQLISWGAECCMSQGQGLTGCWGDAGGWGSTGTPAERRPSWQQPRLTGPCRSVAVVLVLQSGCCWAAGCAGGGPGAPHPLRGGRSG